VKISVAMCTYNGEKYINEQINSILSQTIVPDEIIICDDVSTDNTIGIINDISNQIIKLHQNPKNLGFTKNFEQAIKMCSGDIIFLSDQDDVWLPNKVEVILNAFKDNPEAYMIFSDTYLVDKNLNVFPESLWDRLEVDYNKFNIYDLIQGPVVTGSSLAFKPIALDYTGSFPLIFGHDEWMAFVLTSLGRATPLNQKLIYYRQHEDQKYGVREKTKPESLFVRLRNRLLGKNIRHYSMQLTRLKKYQKFLKNLPNQTPYLLLTDYVQHIETRFNLPKNKISRFTIICNEIPKYLKYDRPFTAFKDWINL